MAELPAAVSFSFDEELEKELELDSLESEEISLSDRLGYMHERYYYTVEGVIIYG